MNGFIDMHTHILPEVDDGAQSMGEALKLVRMAFENGTRALIVTPHFRGKYKENSPAWLQEVFSVFSQMVWQELPQMELFLGSEAYYEQATPALLSQKNVLSINGSRYCLLEFSPGTPRSQMETGVAETIRHGFTPILAHVERYSAFHDGSNLADEVLSQGALIQVNAGSILGKHGLQVKRLCHKLLKERKVHFIASDAHDAQNRPPVLRDCFHVIQKKYGGEYGAQLFYENARAVIDDKVILEV